MTTGRFHGFCRKGIWDMNREELFSWCRQQYGTEPDYPWADRNAVLRHRDTGKWYGAVLEVRRDRLGMQGEDSVDVLNVKCDPMLIGSLRMQPGFLPAYHMNKENWISILLDGAVSKEQIQNLTEISWQMTKKKRKNKSVSKQGE